MYEEFVTLHKPQLLACGVPEIYWPTLYKKLESDDLESSNVFQVLQIDYADDVKQPGDPNFTVQVTHEQGISNNDPQDIFLIDHAWTFRISDRRKLLSEIPSLRDRMASMLGIDNVNDINEVIECICNEMWKYCLYYTMSGLSSDIEHSMPVWYMMDELGSRIQHSDNPNVIVTPFLYITKQITYSILFPLRSIAQNEYLLRDYVVGIPIESEYRKALLHPWHPCDFTMESFTQTTPSKEYFLSGRIDETLPVVESFPTFCSRALKVFTQYKYVHKYLTHPNFEICDDESSADILWYTQHFKNYEELSLNRPNTFVNQFPFENVITIKDLLSAICRIDNIEHHDINSLDTYPEWLPTTYNLETELIQFVSYFQNRLKKKLDNTWILKPFNLARGLDTHITNNLNCILQICRSGPKIVQKYIENPVLFLRPDTNIMVKFDIRYVVLLKSIKPLDVYIYNNFFLRFANKSFSLDNFDEYEKHFTVMNYDENATLFHLKCEEFKTEWVKQYPDHNYTNIEKMIKQMLKQVFLCATSKDPPMGIKENPQSRALYAVDLMLNWHQTQIRPKLLEVNWMPDCKRACEYYPDFYNDIFELLFLDKTNTNFQKL
ncbi:tubulin--tyrosine ligase-like protein 12 [Ctenocephalides felis]|uniref:tubulin--tyrosine ligase-like protein 12 n=1 Tax=Ctenocephalides felis TaxID=7515 RepID=UPI000E6E5518|nr:tubulin--tyrosine ligase-like protein 12 [Ctenocephalides felis]